MVIPHVVVLPTAIGGKKFFPHGGIFSNFKQFSAQDRMRYLHIAYLVSGMYSRNALKT